MWKADVRLKLLRSLIVFITKQTFQAPVRKKCSTISIFSAFSHKYWLSRLLSDCRLSRMETWTTSGSVTSGCPVWVYRSTAPTSWSPWWTPACLTTSPRRTSEDNSRWWIASTGKTRRSKYNCSFIRLDIRWGCRVSLVGTNVHR